MGLLSDCLRNLFKPGRYHATSNYVVVDDGFSETARRASQGTQSDPAGAGRYGGRYEAGTAQPTLEALVRLAKALLDGMIIQYQTKQMMGNLSS